MSDALSYDPILLTVLGGLFVFPLVWAISHLTPRPQNARPNPLSAPPQPAILLYRNGFLTDANPKGLALLETADTNPEIWVTLAQLLKPDFPDFPSTQGNNQERDVSTFTATDPEARGLVTLEQWEDFARVRLTFADPDAPARGLPNIDDTALCAPYPIWISDKSGEITWTNEAYIALANRLGHASEPLPRLFASDFDPDEPQRAKAEAPNSDDNLWFDISTRRKGTSRIHYASDANAIVHAEVAQRNFVQTLTKTFAQLSIGLAIFDRNRQLTLFNPALIDLTHLPADFLSSRPSLLTFFDRLRETRMIPEPKNYSSWRQQIAELVIAAADDRYCETWSLPSGVTYKVNGRPHPDGAIALLFEDISAEVSLTRRFRSELDLVQAVLDTLDEAVVVFSPVGTAAFSNGAYRRFWKTQPETNLSDYSTRDALDMWQERFEPSDIWTNLEDHLVDINPRPDLVGAIKTKEGKTKCIRAIYLHGGNKAVVFSDLPGALPTPLELGTIAATTYPACEEEVAV
ncbi:MAG: PAS domain-containing protein [Rhodobacteraceae bacterium]|nr:PAS domain-containing protein [Paracoccaceae bacterium]